MWNWHKTGMTLVRIGNRVLTISFVGAMVLMFSYGIYNIWYTAHTYQGGFLSDEIMKLKPVLEDATDQKETFVSLKEKIPDICGWLSVPDTKIDYPVVQGKNNMEYVNKNVQGEYEISGSIFLDYQNTADFQDSYQIVYGHHMKNGAMFGELLSFAETEFFEQHPEGLLQTRDGNYRIEFFACVKTDAFDWNFFTPIVGKSSTKKLLQSVKHQQIQYRNLDVDPKDSLIALSTCNEAETNGRMLLLGRLVKI